MTVVHPSPCFVRKQESNRQSSFSNTLVLPACLFVCLNKAVWSFRPTKTNFSYHNFQGSVYFIFEPSKPLFQVIYVPVSRSLLKSICSRILSSLYFQCCLRGSANRLSAQSSQRASHFPGLTSAGRQNPQGTRSYGDETGPRFSPDADSFLRSLSGRPLAGSGSTPVPEDQQLVSVLRSLADIPGLAGGLNPDLHAAGPYSVDEISDKGRGLGNDRTGHPLGQLGELLRGLHGDHVLNFDRQDNGRSFALGLDTGNHRSSGQWSGNDPPGSGWRWGGLGPDVSIRVSLNGSDVTKPQQSARARSHNDGRPTSRRLDSAPPGYTGRQGLANKGSLSMMNRVVGVARQPEKNPDFIRWGAAPTLFPTGSMADRGRINYIQSLWRNGTYSYKSHLTERTKGNKVLITGNPANNSAPINESRVFIPHSRLLSGDSNTNGGLVFSSTRQGQRAGQGTLRSSGAERAGHQVRRGDNSPTLGNRGREGRPLPPERGPSPGHTNHERGQEGSHPRSRAAAIPATFPLSDDVVPRPAAPLARQPDDQAAPGTASTKPEILVRTETRARDTSSAVFTGSFALAP